MNPARINVFWFRRDLRLQDNTGLFYALMGSRPVFPLFIFDSDILDKLHNKTDRRINFIHRQLQTIQKKLRDRGSDLLVLHGQPEKIWTSLIAEYDVESVFFNHDYEPAAVIRDKQITGLLESRGIQVTSFKDQVKFERSEIVKADGNPYTVYTPYSKKWREQLESSGLHIYPSENLQQNFAKISLPDIPSLTQIGFTESKYKFPATNPQESIIRNYHQNRDFPDREGTTHIGIHLRFGTVSVRQLIRKALELNDTWLAELIWREFFMMILHHFPAVVDNPFKSKYANIPWRNDRSDFEKWCLGTTGYPLVDAGMRELNETGFMHNRVRMVTASFLTKHLLIDWRWGERYFAEKLLDYDLAANNGNWQWAAGCGCDAAPYFRIFNPAIQAQKFDPAKKYVRRWLPELETNAYPPPMVEHTYARERVLQAFGEALRP